MEASSDDDDEPGLESVDVSRRPAARESSTMPAFVLVPATPDDLRHIARLQFEACSVDAGFRTIFPKGATPSSVQHVMDNMDQQMEDDQTAHYMIVKDSMTGEIASYAIWNFFPAQTQDEIDADMLKDDFPWPSDANAKAGNSLVHNSNRKKYEVVSKWFGSGSPFAYLNAIGTNPEHQKQGAASLLLKWGIERADDKNLPAYLEATKPGYNIYRKHGFEEVDNLNIEISPWGGEDFLNFCMIRPARSPR